MAFNNLFLGARPAFGGGDKPKPWAVKSLSDLVSSFDATGCKSLAGDVALNSADDTGLHMDDGLLCPLLTIGEGVKKRERLSPKYRDDRLHAHVRIQTWDEKQFRRVFRVSKRLFRKIFDKMVSAKEEVYFVPSRDHS